jgi:hypothetical protein
MPVLGEMYRVTEGILKGKHICYGNVIRHPESRNRLNMIDDKFLEDIDDIDSKLSNFVEYAFDLFLDQEYIKAERKFGKVILYTKDEPEKLCGKLIISIEEKDFSSYTEDETMLVAKVLDFLGQKEIPLIEDNETFTSNEIYSYLQFNMDYRIKNGIPLNTTRKLPYKERKCL